MSRHRTRVTVGLAVALVLAALMLAGCGDDAFESNDYYMTYLTSQTISTQVANSSGRAKDEAAVGILKGTLVVDQIALADRRHEEAMDYYQEGDDSAAADILDEAIKQRPDDAAYRRDRALVAISQGDIGTAETNWKKQDEIAEENGWTDDAWYWAESLAEADELALLAIEEGPSDGAPNTRLIAAYHRQADVLEGAAAHAKARGDAELAQEYEDDAIDLRSAAFEEKTPDTD